VRLPYSLCPDGGQRSIRVGGDVVQLAAKVAVADGDKADAASWPRQGAARTLELLLGR
jgi:hypothetical protein